MVESPQIAKSLIATRIKARRQERGLSQEGLATLLGFKDRQTVSAIETGIRRVTADELILAAAKMEASLEYFTDPFRLAGEGCFSWRMTHAGMEELAKHERDADRWIAAFRVLSPLVGRRPRLLRRALRISARSRCEEATLAGERFASVYGLGEVPALRLREVMEQELGILVLMVHFCPGILAAACRLPELDAVLISRTEVVGRRHFELAHELFHLLTWDAMPPKHHEDAKEVRGNRVEQLADSFAGAVLMPAKTLERFGPWKGLTEGKLITRLNHAADEIQVTSSALRQRLVALRQLERYAAVSLAEPDLRNNGSCVSKDQPSALFSRTFVEVLGLAIDQGHVSLGCVAHLCDMGGKDLEHLFASHGLRNPVDRGTGIKARVSGHGTCAK